MQIISSWFSWIE